jgi:hypothetical protein
MGASHEPAQVESPATTGASRSEVEEEGDAELGSSLDVAAVLKLQRLAGNRAVGGILAGAKAGGAARRSPVARASGRPSPNAAVAPMVAPRSPATGAPFASLHTSHATTHPAPPAAPVPVQRYQAGEHGHGGIEEEALGAAHFGGTMTSGEIGAVYLGNWMRDFSQIGDAHSPRILTILNILSMGEFGQPVTAEQVGGYLPSEHLDNPRGGESIEDPRAQQMPTGDWSGLSGSQQHWVREEQTEPFQAEMRRRAATSHIPEYIEAGKEHAKRELLTAATQPRGAPAGMQALGNGLHTIEDYFAHSNFTDACIYMLAAAGRLPPGSTVYQRLQARGRDLGYDPSGGLANGPTPQIMTGTYRSEGNKRVSLLEQLRSEVETGALRQAVLRGATRLAAAGRLDLGPIIGADLAQAIDVAGAAVGGMSGGGSGALRGAAEGWQRGHGFGAVTGSMHGMASGAVSGARSGARAGRDRAQLALVGWVVSELNRIIAEAAAVPGAAHHADQYGHNQTNVATANDRRQGDLAPNHSQLAKDDLEHPVYGASRALAVHVDTALGVAMAAAWDQGTRVPEAVSAVRRLLDTNTPLDVASVPGGWSAAGQLVTLVDTFVSNPALDHWWEAPLLRALQSGH